MSHRHQHDPVSYPVAELERRFYAFVIDRLLTWGAVAVLCVGLWLLDLEPLVIVAAGVGALFVMWLVLAVMTGVAGTTPGKSATGLRVVSEDSGTPVGVGRALLRSAVVGLATIPTIGMGLLTLAWTAVEDRDRQRRGWHDHLAKSVVVDVRPVEVVEEQEDSAPRAVVNLTAMRLVPAPAVEVSSLSTPRRVNPEHSVRRQAQAESAAQTPPPVTAPPP